MRLRGKELTPPAPVSVSFFRGAEEITFVAKAVLNFDRFNALCPVPRAPVTTFVSTGKKVRNTEDHKYNQRISDYIDQKTAWIIIESLSATEGLEWDTVKIDEPDTWMNFEKDLTSFLGENEYERLIEAVKESNNPTAKSREALDSFTRSQVGAQVMPSSQKDGQESIPSGELANA